MLPFTRISVLLLSLLAYHTMPYDLSGLDIADVIEVLWEHQTVASFFKNIPWMAPACVRGTEELKMSLQELKENGSVHIDYICGRALKIQFQTGSPLIDLSLYNRDAGPGTGERVLDELKRRKHVDV